MTRTGACARGGIERYGAMRRNREAPLAADPTDVGAKHLKNAARSVAFETEKRIFQSKGAHQKQMSGHQHVADVSSTACPYLCAPFKIPRGPSLYVFSILSTHEKRYQQKGSFHLHHDRVISTRLNIKLTNTFLK